MPGVEEPIYFWFPDIAPSGMMFYTGDLFPEWKGNLFVGAMEASQRGMVRLVLNGERVAAEERLLSELKQSIRDIRQGPRGEVYVLTRTGSLLKLTPKK
jgi:glucose/arabinose dehydrogenase